MISKNHILFLLLLFASASLAFGQSVEEIEQQMNEIKLNEDMVYGEGFKDNKDDARSLAMSDLLMTVNQLREGQGMSPVEESSLAPLVKELSYSNGSRFAVLVYMPLSKAYNSPVPTSPTVPTVPTTPTAPTAPTTPAAQVDEDIIDVLCGQDNWAEIKGFLADYKRLKKIKETGVAQSPAAVPDDAVSILVDEMYGILAILSPKKSNPRINYRTNNNDSETNYSNCKVIVWYR